MKRKIADRRRDDGNLSLVLAAPAQAAGDAAKGRVKAISCMGCHGIPGYHNAYPNYPVPQGGRAEPRVRRRRAQGVQVGTSAATSTMQAQAASLSEQDMRDIAAYFAIGGQRLTVSGSNCPSMPQARSLTHGSRRYR